MGLDDTGALDATARGTDRAPDAGPRHAQDQMFRDALQLIAEGITETVGFKLATISVVRATPDGREELEVVADAGDDPSTEAILGRRTPLGDLMAEITKAEDWGHFQFLPYEAQDAEAHDLYGWIVPDFVPIDAPDAWHPLDLLVALLRDNEGVLRGTLAIDLPHNGRRPGPDQRRLLETLAVRAARAVVTTLEREELSEQVRLAETARRLVREASAHRDLAEVLAECQLGLVEGFRSQGSWIQTFDPDGRASGAIYATNGEQIELPGPLVELAGRSARECWDQQVAAVLAGDHSVRDLLSPSEQTEIVGYLDSIGVRSLLFVPLGAGDECLGNLVLTRSSGREWTSLDQQAALDVGHDLGRVILNARTFQREHELVVELQALDSYKSQLIATVSHELKNPLTAINGYLELLQASESLGGRDRSAVAAMGRGTERLSRVVEDLLLMSKVGDPHHRLIPAEVDVVRIVGDIADLVDVTARRKQLDVAVEVPPTPVTALGDASEIDRLVANLVSNAVKYTPNGRRVSIKVERCDDVVRIQVSDEGLGISEADQQHLFEEFFRSTNPEATALPGTGLGLAIVKRIVERHGGAIDVDTALGSGSTFTVTLPAAG